MQAAGTWESSWSLNFWHLKVAKINLLFLMSWIFTVSQLHGCHTAGCERQTLVELPLAQFSCVNLRASVSPLKWTWSGGGWREMIFRIPSHPNHFFPSVISSCCSRSRYHVGVNWWSNLNSMSALHRSDLILCPPLVVVRGPKHAHIFSSMNNYLLAIVQKAIEAMSLFRPLWEQYFQFSHFFAIPRASLAKKKS